MCVYSDGGVINKFLILSKNNSLNKDLLTLSYGWSDILINVLSKDYKYSKRQRELKGHLNMTLIFFCCIFSPKGVEGTPI